MKHERNTMIIKVGTDTITQKNGLPDQESMLHIGKQIQKLKQELSLRIALISSGAMAFGRTVYNEVKHPEETTEQKQLYASAGQALLIAAWQQCLQESSIVSQILVTRENFDSRKQTKNILRTIAQTWNATKDTIPIINENDTVATQELKFTDNDHLAHILTKRIGASRLAFLTTKNGVQRDLEDPESTIATIEAGNRTWREYVPKEHTSMNGTGGMWNKCRAAEKLATRKRTTYILPGREEQSLIRRILHNEELGTTFLPQ